MSIEDRALERLMEQASQAANEEPPRPRTDAEHAHVFGWSWDDPDDLAIIWAPPEVV